MYEMVLSSLSLNTYPNTCPDISSEYMFYNLVKFILVFIF